MNCSIGRAPCIPHCAVGAAHAFEDSCPHRRVPLSLGVVTDDGLLQCAYHGWSYQGGSGQCSRIPNFNVGEKVSPRITVPAYPLVERDGAIFVQATLGQLPDDKAQKERFPEFKTNFPKSNATGGVEIAIDHRAWLEQFFNALATTLGMGEVLPNSLRSEQVESGLAIKVDLNGGDQLRIKTWSGSGFTELSVCNASGRLVKQVQISIVPIAQGRSQLRWRYHEAGITGRIKNGLAGLPKRIAVQPLQINAGVVTMDSKQVSPLMAQWSALANDEDAENTITTERVAG